jgi:hypothetical protein
MRKNSGHIETVVITLLLAIVMVIVMVLVSRHEKIGGIWALIVAAAFLVAIVTILVSVYLSVRAPKANEAGQISAGSGRSLSDFKCFLDEYAAGLGSNTVAKVWELYEVGEHGLAVEWLSNDIYEANLAIPPEGCRLFQKLAKANNVSDEYWRFMEDGPPYADLQTEEQRVDAKHLARPSLESAEYFARKGNVMVAIRMYREVTGASLPDAKETVDLWSRVSSQQGDREDTNRQHADETC